MSRDWAYWRPMAGSGDLNDLLAHVNHPSRSQPLARPDPRFYQHSLLGPNTSQSSSALQTPPSSVPYPLQGPLAQTFTSRATAPNHLSLAPGQSRTGLPQVRPIADLSLDFFKQKPSQPRLLDDTARFLRPSLPANTHAEYPEHLYANYLAGEYDGHLARVAPPDRQKDLHSAVTLPVESGFMCGEAVPPNKQPQTPSQHPVWTTGSSSEWRESPLRSNRSISSPAAKAAQRRNVSATAEIPNGRRSLATPTTLTNQCHDQPVAHGIPLISPLQALPDKFRTIFPYELFNAVQSKCLGVVFGSKENVVISAPTGSGKTAILELGICKAIADRPHDNVKIVYQAPTKALCSERARDWQRKFSHLNLQVVELTGDTSMTEMRRVATSSIIVTTPEKWDSITRRWEDHRKLLQLVKLFLIDEVHILKESRGATLEAVVSRMKTIGSNVRFIALSATVPNSEDIAVWLGRDPTDSQLPAHCEVFAEEFRPVKLQKFVYGYEYTGNAFMFDTYLDQKLSLLISKHSRGKPTLVFCFTRKSCEATAVKLAETWSTFPADDKTWPPPTKRVPVASADLRALVRHGVAFHHAGMDTDDRRSVEKHFLEGDISVVCCTSTLAVGINLPCHMVVLKGTSGFQDGKLSEYSDLEVMQMLGRAGRPQFDDTATAIILTKSENKDRYEKMVSGRDVLESTLHLNLIEHLNSEIGLRNVYNASTAVKWLSGTFLRVRMQKNPDHYQQVTAEALALGVEEKIREICEREIRLLQNAQLVTDEQSFACTDYGKAMAKYMVNFEAMKKLLQIPTGIKMEQLLIDICQNSDFREFRFRPAERGIMRELNKSPFILYPVKEAVAQTWHKIFLMVQIALGAIDLPSGKELAFSSKQLRMELSLVLEKMQRLTRCLCECMAYSKDGSGLHTALELTRCLAAGAWENRPTQLTQIPGIGPAGMRKLVTQDVRTVRQLAEKSSGDIERLLSRNPPFGKKLSDLLERFPRLNLDATIRGRVPPRGSSNHAVVLKIQAVLGFSNRVEPNWQSKAPVVTFMAETSDGTLAFSWRGTTKKLGTVDKQELLFQVQLSSADQNIACHLSCEEVVGTMVSRVLKHDIPASEFPTLDLTSMSSDQKPGIGAQAGDMDEIDDQFLLEAANHVELSSERTISDKVESAVPTHTDEGEFVPIEALFDAMAEGRDRPSASCQELHGGIGNSCSGPMQLPNGKWPCNHICSGGAPTKAGKTCNHRCCHEGVDRPRKVKAKQQGKRPREDGTEDWSDKPNLNSANAKSSREKSSQLSSKVRKTSKASPTKTFSSSTPPKVRSLDEFHQRHVIKRIYSADQVPVDVIDLSMADEECDGDEANNFVIDVEDEPLEITSQSTDDLEQRGFESLADPHPSISTAEDTHPSDGSIADQPQATEGTGMAAQGFKPGASDVILYQSSRGVSNRTPRMSSAAFQVRTSRPGPVPDEILHPEQTVAVNEPRIVYPSVSTPIRFSSSPILPPTDVTIVQSAGKGEDAVESSYFAAQSPVSTEQKDQTMSLISMETPILDDETSTGVNPAEHVSPTRRSHVEPEWVKEFNPALMDMFRGYVDFVGEKL